MRPDRLIHRRLPSLRRASALAAAATALAAAGLAGCAGSEVEGSAHAQRTAAQVSSDRDQFVGMVASEVLPLAPAAQEKVLNAQAAAGVRLLRQTFLWQEIETRKGQYAWGMHDNLVASAAKAGISVMPIVFGIRKGAGAKKVRGAKVSATTTMPPKSNAEFAKYATVLVQRYGRGGTFWAEHPDLPQHPMVSWQIWNEPNLPAYWGGKPSPKAYAALLKTTAAAVKKVDPQAEIVTGGVPESKLGIPLSRFIRQLVRSPAKHSFDTIAVHPYAKNVSGVLQGARLAQAAADQVGLTNVGVRITEVGWATGKIKSDFTVSETKQSQLVAELLQRAWASASELRLRGVVYYGWRDVRPYPGGKDFWGLHTGLMGLKNTPKASLATFTTAAKAVESAG